MIKKNIIVGLSFAFFLFVLSFVLYLNFSYMGATNSTVEEFIFGNFKSLLFLINMKILLAYMVIGLLIASFSIMLKLEKPIGMLLFNMFFWFMFWVRAVKIYPQLFIPQLFNKGFILKYFQVFVTDYAPFFAIYGIFVISIAVIGIVKKRWIFSIVITVLSLLMVVKIDEGAMEAPSGGETAEKPNVLIFATDSLRPQSISYNGYHRPTPHIDGIFSRGVNFLNAKCSMGRTLPTWTSILTSSYPPDHGMRHMFPTSKDLERDWDTIVKEFNKSGYYTGVISDFAGDIFPSVPYGFQEISSPDLSIPIVLKQRCQEIHYFLLGFLVNPLGRSLFPEIWGMALNKDPWYVTKYTKKSIKRSIKKNKPFFILSFSSNNHFPYVTRHPYYKHYTKKNYNGRHKYGLSADILATFLEARVTPEEVEQIVNHYDNATRLFDDNVGEILQYLKECKIDRNTIVVIMSDHGENLYEKNYGLAHGDHLLGDYANNMVFGVYSPFEDFKGVKIKNTVRDIDIAPTILDLFNMEKPGSFRGTSLLPVMRGGEFSGYPVYMETGIWYSTTTPFIENRVRIPYPFITELLEIEMPGGKIVAKKKFENVVIKAKYKAYQLNENKYIYMPGEDTYMEEYYIDEKKVDPKNITDVEFLKYKEKMIEMFNGKYYIDEKGFIREYITDGGGRHEKKVKIKNEK
ncbi:MAG: sulfatase-like hydrolase/transferase [bacterium]|nr:sulfatase-like hydrolase/transferase [bacterium]